MAGRMGAERVTVKNLKVLMVDNANGLVVVTGCVPGPKDQVIQIQDALGKPWPKGPMTTAELGPVEVAAEAETGSAEAVAV